MKPILSAVVVEDDHDLRYLYQFKLEREGFQVASAADGREGLEVIERLRPDIILVDLRMPIMSGSEMLGRLRAHEWASNIRIIVLTNISKDEAPQALRLLHIDRYVVKAHHTPSQIVAIVHEVLDKRARSI